MGVTLPTFSVLLFQRTLPHLANARTRCRPCVCVASSHHIPCVSAVCLCVAWPASAFLALWWSCSACMRACCSALGIPFFFFFFFFFARKVMSYRRQRKAATQVMQNLGDGTSL